MILSEFRINNQEKVPKEKPLAAPVQGMCTLCLLWFIPNYITMKKKSCDSFLIIYMKKNCT